MARPGQVMWQSFLLSFLFFCFFLLKKFCGRECIWPTLGQYVYIRPKVRHCAQIGPKLPRCAYIAPKVRQCAYIWPKSCYYAYTGPNLRHCTHIGSKLPHWVYVELILCYQPAHEFCLNYVTANIFASVFCSMSVR